MGSSTQKTTSTSGPTNPQVTKTQTTLLKGLEDAYKGGIAFNPQSLYPGVGGTTKAGWAQTLGAAGNQDYASGIGGAISDFGDIASGKRFGMNDPGYAALRAKAGEDTLTGVNSIFTGSGRFGSGSHVKDATKELGNVYSGMDYANYQNDVARQQQAAGMLPGLFTASLAPSAATGAVGSAQDADALAKRQAENDLFRRKNDAPWDALGRASSILNGTAGAGGTTSTTTSPSTPWWQSLLGVGIGLL
jgi:hypothetical protein